MQRRHAAVSTPVTVAAFIGAPQTHRLRLRGYQKTVVVSLVNPDGKEKQSHFLTYVPDDPVELLFVAPCAALHNYSAGLLFPCAAGEVADEHMRGKDESRFTWKVDFEISPEGYERASQFVEGPARKWNYHVRKRNCVTFAHRVAKEAGIDLPRPLVQRPNNFVARIRGAIRRGKIEALGGVLPPGRRLGALPQNVLRPFDLAITA